MSQIAYPVAINLQDLVSLCDRHALAVDRLLIAWIDHADAETVPTDDGLAIRLRAAETPIRQRQLSGLVDLLARQAGPGMIGRPVRSYGFTGGRWRRIGVPPQRKLW
jgi:hypothetical protein